MNYLVKKAGVPDCIRLLKRSNENKGCDIEMIFRFQAILAKVSITIVDK